MKNVLLSGGLAFILCIIGTRFVIAFLAKHGYGQFVRDDGPSAHHVKRGTPSMGGIAIVVAVILAYFGAHLITWTRPSVSGFLLLGLIFATALIGFADDFTKIRKRRSLGLTARGKMIAQALVGGVFGFLVLQFPDSHGTTPGSSYVSVFRDIEWLKLPLVLAIIWITLLVISTSNAVNLTDGLDGLATGSSAMVFGAYTLVNIWQFNQRCSAKGAVSPLIFDGQCYVVRNPLDLAMISLALCGACFAFLWWNSKPAKIFMGDTGSLALGAAMAGFAVTTRTEVLLVVFGGLFVIETLSDIIQVGYFKLSGGKRVFKMAPLHHHFELKGWSETTVVIRFWIICGLFVALAIVLFYGEWVPTR